ncbi:MAG: hypothetical protein ACD_13C00209G0001, partial [uncultured bacterium]
MYFPRHVRTLLSGPPSVKICVEPLVNKIASPCPTLQAIRCKFLSGSWV